MAGGLHRAFDAAAAAGCDCMQIFVKNQRQWSARPLLDEEAEAFRGAAAATGVSPILAHASYLINLAAPDRDSYERSINALIDEWTRCEQLGIGGLVVHPGAHLGATLEAGIRRVAEAITRAKEVCCRYQTHLLLETTAGQGTTIGYRFEQLAEIIYRAQSSSGIGICLDTCHLFAAGYDFRTREGYEATLAELDRSFSVCPVSCIHMNDSLRGLGSRVDRHAHIGKGKIGKAGFAHFVNDPRFAGVAMVLETPKGKDGRGTDLDRVNLKRLRSLVQNQHGTTEAARHRGNTDKRMRLKVR